MVARMNGVHEVAGSNPVTQTNKMAIIIDYKTYFIVVYEYEFHRMGTILLKVVIIWVIKMRK
jgi:hypothetical protein